MPNKRPAYPEFIAGALKSTMCATASPGSAFGCPPMRHTCLRSDIRAAVAAVKLVHHVIWLSTSTFWCAGAQNSITYANGGSGFMLLSNYTTSAITVASVATRCVSRGPAYPVVEATISNVHQVIDPIFPPPGSCPGRVLYLLPVLCAGNITWATPQHRVVSAEVPCSSPLSLHLSGEVLCEQAMLGGKVTCSQLVGEYLQVTPSTHPAPSYWVALIAGRHDRSVKLGDNPP